MAKITGNVAFKCFFFCKLPIMLSFIQYVYALLIWIMLNRHAGVSISAHGAPINVKVLSNSIYKCRRNEIKSNNHEIERKSLIRICNKFVVNNFTWSQYTIEQFSPDKCIPLGPSPPPPPPPQKKKILV